MPAYLITFRFAQNESRLARFDNFMATFEGREWWAETGSTIIVHDDDAIDDFCRRIFSPACFDERVDVAAVFDLDLRDGRARGRFRDYRLFDLLPWLERV